MTLGGCSSSTVLVSGGLFLLPEKALTANGAKPPQAAAAERVAKSSLGALQGSRTGSSSSRSLRAGWSSNICLCNIGTDFNRAPSNRIWREGEGFIKLEDTVAVTAVDGRDSEIMVWLCRGHTVSAPSVSSLSVGAARSSTTCVKLPPSNSALQSQGTLTCADR